MSEGKHFLYIAVFGFTSGIAADSLLDSVLHPYFIYGLCGFLTVIFLAAILISKKSRLGIMLFIFTLLFTLGFVRNHIVHAQYIKPTAFDQLVDQKIVLKGILVEDQERRDFNNRLTVLVQPQSVRFNVSQGYESQKVLVTTNNPKIFRYGDMVQIAGQLVRPVNFLTETGREFDYVGYLEANDIRFLMKNATVELLGHDPPSRIIATLFAVKRKFVQSLGAMLPEPQSSLAAGILIDGKQSINGELQEKFQKTGLVHIVVLSGYNVSIVAEAIGKSLMFLPRSIGLTSAAGGIILFALITGASATVVRASIMAILVLLSRMSLRNYDPARGLFIASGLMLIHNPLILFHSPSFQLSFLATFAVVKVIPTLEILAESRGPRFFRKEGSRGKNFFELIPERFGLRDLIISNILVQFFLFPILTWMTGFFSAVSLPVNLLVLPFIPLTMLAAFLTGLAGFIAWPLAAPFAFISQTLLSYELAIVNFFAKFSLAEISLNVFSGWVVVSFYMVAIVGFVFWSVPTYPQRLYKTIDEK